MFKIFHIFIMTLILFGVRNASARSKSTIEKIGDYTQVIVPAYAFGMAISEDGWTGAKQFAYSFGAMEATVYGLKYVVEERRPNKADNRSFPSGHTASAFSGATFIHARYGLMPALVPYIMAGFTAYSRIHANKHWWWDTLAGASIAGIMSYTFVDRRNGVSVSANPQYVGFKATF